MLHQNAMEVVYHAISSLYGCNHQFVRVHHGKRNLISCILDQLLQECSLRSPVPFAEGVKHVGTAIEVRNLINKRFMIQADIIVHSVQSAENTSCHFLDLRCFGKICPLLGHINRANFSCPIIDVLKEEAMNSFIMSKIKVPGERILV